MQAWRSLRAYGIFAALALAAVLLLSRMDVPYAHPSQAASLRFSVFVPIVLLGCLGAWLFGRFAPATLPEGAAAWGRRVATDAAIGAGLGLLAVGLDLMLGLSGHVAAKLGVGSIHIPLPYSALAYSAGAVAVESLYRVIPIPIVLWIVCGVLTRGRGVTPTFWVVAALTALLEPLSQATILGERPGMMTALGLFILGFNLVCAWLFWRRGVASPLVARLAFYAVWHVLLGPRLVGA